ncbi:class I adenylate-forming enzyme family protein [Rhodococcus sp. IEGM 1366]|uniref:class I adenylate-forming enzyme family protein n=1 Tax=Rhodococcus sp. IEGM 1366 TaxID=3082223 RepID=UPI0029556EF5|nr:class I adenylate-forming enzyme family protein [Rhodococcus sp. IEGM 1366]MDV8071015.1 class I adenylate-forming enzyme family protein [Rhodococcus sp. IEGM 1366]
MKFEHLWLLMEWRAAQSPDSEMIVDERGRRVSFGEFRSRAERVAAALSVEHGVGSGTVVMWQLPTTVEALVLTVALARLGAIQNPVMPTFNARDLEFVVSQTGTKLMITTSEWSGKDLSGAIREVAAKMPDIELISLDGDLPESPAPAPAFDVADGSARWIFYTSGTTSKPKGARHTDASVLASSWWMGESVQCTSEDRVGMAFPVAHIGGCGTWLGASLLYGLTLIIDSEFDIERTVELQQRERVTLAGSGVVFIHLYLQAQRALPPGERLFPQIRAMTSGAAPKPPTLHADVKREMGGVGVLSGYGMTEAPILAMSSNGDNDLVLAAAEGKLSPEIDAKIAGRDGTSLPLGEIGELCVKGPQVMQGYVDTALNDSAFDEDGYLRTGDLASLDADGNLTIHGRLKDIIIRKGENISARAIEDELVEHPDVADVAVVGLPHPEWGEVACAVVTLRATATGLAMEDVTAFLDERDFPKRQRPERLEVVEDLPRTPTGKLAKDVLRRNFGTPSMS